MGKTDLSFLQKPKPMGILDPDSEKELKTKSNKKEEQKIIGRPPKKSDEKKSESVRVYFTKEEKKKLEKQANLGSGITIPLGHLIRKALIESKMI